MKDWKCSSLPFSSSLYIHFSTLVNCRTWYTWASKWIWAWRISNSFCRQLLIGSGAPNNICSISSPFTRNPQTYFKPSNIFQTLKHISNPQAWHISHSIAFRTFNQSLIERGWDIAKPETFLMMSPMSKINLQCLQCPRLISNVANVQDQSPMPPMSKINFQCRQCPRSISNASNVQD